MTDSKPFQGKKVTYRTLGCKLNFSETATISRTLQQLGAVTAHEGEAADFCIVNTCSVTNVADAKGRQLIHRLVKENPDAVIAVLGCYAQLKPQEVADIPGVDVVIGAEEKKNFVRYLQEAAAARQKGTVHTTPLREIRSFVPSCSRGDRTRYFLKVQDGCDYYCTYCTIPMARGRSRNGSISSLVRLAEEAAEEGGREIVITGVNIGDFGRSTHESFLDLLKALDRVEGIARYRISSIEPNLLTDDIIHFVADSRAFMPHFHIPLQSGSDAVLQLMHRRYDTQLFAHKVDEIRKVLPHCFIGVDVIVGTRGETGDYFEEGYRFLEGLDVSKLHVFSYSERPGTAALKISHVVSEPEKHERSRRLLELSDKKTRDFYLRHVGQTLPVLLEHARSTQVMHGFTPNYIKVEVPFAAALDNHIRPVRLGGLTADGTALQGEILNTDDA